MNTKTVPSPVILLLQASALIARFCPSPALPISWVRAGPGRVLPPALPLRLPARPPRALQRFALLHPPSPLASSATLPCRARAIGRLAMASSGWKAALDKITNNGFIAALKEARREGYLLRILVDGNLLHTKLREHDATLVGEDTQGNKYYEKKDNIQFGRHRWVVYADAANYNASAVPPEWHAWLHYVTDHTAEQLLALKPTRYGEPHKENLTGRGDGMVYHTKGHALNPNKRDWKRYQSWQPEDPDSERKSSATSPNSI